MAKGSGLRPATPRRHPSWASSLLAANASTARQVLAGGPGFSRQLRASARLSRAVYHSLVLRQVPTGCGPECRQRAIVARCDQGYRVLAALKRDGWAERRRSGSHRVLTKGNRTRVWAYHEGVDLGKVALAKVAKDYGYEPSELGEL